MAFRQDRGYKGIDSFYVGSKLAAVWRDCRHFIINGGNCLESNNFLGVPIRGRVFVYWLGHKQEIRNRSLRFRPNVAGWKSARVI